MSTVKTITTNIIENNYTRRMILKVLVGSLIILGLAYVYLIGSITFNILARKSLESTIATYNNNISQLELTYLSNLSEIDKNHALSIGFTEARNNIFATRSISQVAIR